MLPIAHSGTPPHFDRAARTGTTKFFKELNIGHGLFQPTCFLKHNINTM